jgi:hypothetical protein
MLSSAVAPSRVRKHPSQPTASPFCSIELQPSYNGNGKIKFAPSAAKSNANAELFPMGSYTKVVRLSAYKVAM